VQVFGNDYPTPDGTCIRDYIHVDDLADAHVKSLDYLAGGGSSTALNVGTGTGSSVMEVIEATERITGRSVPWQIAPRRAGDPVATFADPTKAAQLLDWHPAHGLDDIVASAWEWHSTHLDGYVDSPSP
jgi:UDP-glucose 4-epimerase